MTEIDTFHQKDASMRGFCICGHEDEVGGRCEMRPREREEHGQSGAQFGVASGPYVLLHIETSNMKITTGNGVDLSNLP